LTKPKEPAPTGGTEPQDSNPDLKTTQITETATATAQRPNLTDPKLDLQKRPLRFDLHDFTAQPDTL
jgi:hypothetical protein